MKATIKEIKSHYSLLKRKFLTGLAEVKNVESLTTYAVYRNRLTKLRQEQLKSGKLSLDKAKEVIKAKYLKENAIALEIDLKHRANILNASDFVGCDITIEWKRNSTWGSNPTAFAEVFSKNNICDCFTSGSISGYGYDKQSTAFARSINQSLSFKKLLLKNRSKIENIYGHIGFTLSGGVGVGCYYQIFEACGFVMRQVSNTSNTYVFTITKK